jgi:hypothetical protein
VGLRLPRYRRLSYSDYKHKFCLHKIMVIFSTSIINMIKFAVSRIGPSNTLERSYSYFELLLRKLVCIMRVKKVTRGLKGTRLKALWKYSLRVLDGGYNALAD